MRSKSAIGFLLLVLVLIAPAAWAQMTDMQEE